MHEIKFRILNQFSVPMPIERATDFKAHIDYENGEVLEKSNIEIVKASNGEGKFSLSKFEISGLKNGQGTPFLLTFKMDGKNYKILFSNAIDVEEDEKGTKSII